MPLLHWQYTPLAKHLGTTAKLGPLANRVSCASVRGGGKVDHPLGSDIAVHSGSCCFCCVCVHVIADV